MSTKKSIDQILENPTTQAELVLALFSEIMLVTNAPLQYLDFDLELMCLAEQIAEKFEITKK